MKKFDAEKLFFDKMAAFCILTSFSLLAITLRGVSNKHCLLSFFICIDVLKTGTMQFKS